MSEKKRIVQTLTCKCGVQYAASAVPHCHQDKSWHREVRACANAGGTVDMIDMDEKPLRLYDGDCTCGLIKAK